MAPDVADKLAALRVDIADVEMPRTVTASADTPAVALDGSTLEPATLVYDVTMEAAGPVDGHAEHGRATPRHAWRRGSLAGRLHRRLADGVGRGHAVPPGQAT